MAGRRSSAKAKQEHEANKMTSEAIAPVVRPRGLSLGPLWLQVLIAAILGVLIGLFWPHIGGNMQPLATGFVKLIRMLLAPVIFTVVVGIARMGDLSEVARVGIKAIEWLLRRLGPNIM
jgi:L-cystine uptake protein TcyP (sodium:dicarboxylate symporter family)